MNNKDTGDLAGNDLTSDDQKVASKTSITASDIGSAFKELNLKPGGKDNTPVYKSLGIWIFSLLLIFSGAAIAVFTFVSVIGIVIGVIMIIAGITMPFLASRK
jgi:hypothetical protein